MTADGVMSSGTAVAAVRASRSRRVRRSGLVLGCLAVAGVAIGKLERCDWSEQRPEWPRTKSLEQVLEERLEPLGVPVLYLLPVGHATHLATLPLGVTATLDADARTLTVDQPALRPATT